MLDAGYDQLKNYEAARDLKAQAIIPLNLRNEKEPPAGMTSKGTPCCSMGFPMTYWGLENGRLKFRCPHATGKVDCPLGMTACSNSNYGMVVKVSGRDDLRRYCLPHRESRGWKDLYNKRTSVERCNSRLKDDLTANRLQVWGIQKVTTHLYLNAIVLLVSALAVAKQHKISAA
ncbi:Transposase DDE domain-containing protein [Paenibacillus sophorae]|uniref:Transposase DDE domain-containing protein n=1 Tax=Paenibacillus sophorae TaxID=1333845 RepID=A0A1H8V8E6_9BACL|nr:Transposase DDE domain-containing protein [Paenibacillus sophorae]